MIASPRATPDREESFSSHVLYRLFAAFVALCALLLLGGDPASAQTPTPPPLQVMTIEVPDPDQPDLLPGSSNRDFFGDRYAVFAAGALCTSGVVPASGGFTVVVGEPGQPAVCGTPGTRVELAGIATGPFVFDIRVSPGATVTLDNWAGYPTDTPFPAYFCSWMASEGASHPACEMVGPPGSGFIQWRIAPRLIFADPRVVLALNLLIDQATVESAASSPSELVYGDPEILSMMEGIPAADRFKLLQAAGVIDQDDRITNLRAARTCQVWVPARNGGALRNGEPVDVELVAVGEALGREMARVFAELGLVIEPCEVTSSLEAADLFVYDAATMPDVDFAAYPYEGAFVADAGITPGSAAGDTGGGGPVPAHTGYGPLATGGTPWTAAVLVAFTVATLAGARSLVGRRLTGPRHGQRLVTIAALGVVGAALVAGAPQAASAQTTGEPMTVEFDFGADDDWLADLGGIVAYMGTTECGSVDFAAGERTLVVGGPGTPTACNQPWRVVNFMQFGPEGEGPLANDPIFHPGVTVTVSTITPFPAVDGPDVPPFFIVVPLSDGVTRQGLADFESLTAYVRGIECGTVSTVAFEEPLTLPVGAPGTPDVCREEGAEVIIVYGSGGGFGSEGSHLVVRPSVRLGYHYTLTNPAVEPVSTGPALGSLTGDVPSRGGVGLVQWSGGSVEALRAATADAGCDLKGIWITVSGRMIGYVLDAPAFVNAGWSAVAGAGIPTDTPLMIVCAAPAPDGVDSCDPLKTLGVASYAFTFETPEQALEDLIADLDLLPANPIIVATSESHITWDYVTAGGIVVGSFVTEDLGGGSWVVSSGRYCA